MARIDWNKVAEDYQNSVLNKERLHQYAQKAAQALRSRNVFFDGFTDAAYEAAKEAAWQAWQRQGFFHRLFHRPPAPPAPSCPGLDDRHIGYWVLETSEEEFHTGRRFIDWDVTKSFRIKRTRTKLFTDHASIRTTKWVLLEDGGLAACLTIRSYQVFPYWESMFWLKESGRVALNGLERRNETLEDHWKSMSDEEILLLDHKKRSVRRRNVMRDDYYVEDSECIRADNYLLTGKKGGGCSKKITALLKKHGL